MKIKHIDSIAFGAICVFQTYILEGVAKLKLDNWFIWILWVIFFTLLVWNCWTSSEVAVEEYKKTQK